MQIIERPIAEVYPYPGNPRRNAKSVAKVASSIRAYGFRQPIVVDRNGIVVAGHTRLEAAKLVGLTMVPVHVAADLTEAQARAYRLADNRTAEDSDWQDDLLTQELLALQGEGVSLAPIGFNDDELARLLTPPLAADDGEVDEPPAEVVTRPGDLIVMGTHRLLCGNSLDPACIARVCDGGSPGALMFDPPFEDATTIAAMDLDGYGAPDVLVFGDCMHDTARRARTTLPWRFSFVWDGVTRWVVPGRPLIAHKSADWFSRGGKYNHDAVKDSRDIRDKPSKGKNSRGTYEIAPDPRGQSLASVFRSPITNESHGAEHSKPVLWLALLFGNCTAGMVLDPFAGSGSSLIACERIGRAWCGVELNPAYCDVIVSRWERETGLTARRPGEEGVDTTLAPRRRKSVASHRV